MGTAVTTTKERSITALMSSEDARKRIMPMLTHGVTMDRIEQEVYFAVQKNPEIIQCTGASIVEAVAKGVSLGLIIGDTYHLVPFNVKVKKWDAKKQQEVEEWEKRCQGIIDYRGLADLAVRAKAGIRAVDMECVYENEFFVYEKGIEEILRHKPASTAAERGKMVGAYCIVRRGFNASTSLYMPLDDIDAIRKKHSKQWKNGDCPAWYAKKTVVRQALKLVPKDPRIAPLMQAVAEEELAEFGTVEPMGGTPSRALSPGDEIPTRPENVGPNGEDETFQDDRDLDDDGGR